MLAFLTLDFGRGSAAAIIGGIIILVVGAVLVALLAAGIEALRRETLREFPDAGTAARAPMPFAALSRLRTSNVATGRSVADELVRLSELRDAGVISGEEFDRAKTLALA